MKPRLPTVELVILVAGLAAAAAAGVAGYRTVGLYGDGPFASGYHREIDPQTRQSVLVHEVDTSQGRIRRVIDNTMRVREVRLDADGDGVMESSVKVDRGKPTGAGFSIANDGVIDAWAYRDAANQLVRIEVSTKRNGRIDRWEHYRNGRLARVDLDINGNGRPDRWQTFEDGILMDTFLDLDEDGKADGPPPR